VAVGVLVLIIRIKAIVENGYKCKGTAPTKNRSKINGGPCCQKLKIPKTGYAFELVSWPFLDLGKWAHILLCDHSRSIDSHARPPFSIPAFSFSYTTQTPLPQRAVVFYCPGKVF
jgi:hypothetical protein